MKISCLIFAFGAPANLSLELDIFSLLPHKLKISQRDFVQSTALGIFLILLHNTMERMEPWEIPLDGTERMKYSWPKRK